MPIDDSGSAAVAFDTEVEPAPSRPTTTTEPARTPPQAPPPRLVGSRHHPAPQAPPPRLVGSWAQPADANAPEAYFNRELTWLNFAWRVVHEAADART